MKKTILATFLAALTINMTVTSQAATTATRVKDIARVEVGQESQLIGYGLVVGLDGTGDNAKAIFTVQSIANMLERMGVTISQDKMRVKNVAAVMVTAKISAFTKTDGKIDVGVSSLGDATSLKGGMLLLTPLKGIDGRVYAIAQGQVSVDSVVDKNGKETYFTSGNVYQGATIVSQPPASGWLKEYNGVRYFLISLNRPDFTTAGRIVDAINEEYKKSAQAIDPGMIRVLVPNTEVSNVVEFTAKVENMPIEPDTVAKVIINEHTGTVVVGQNVVISPVAVSNGALNIEIGKKKAGKGKYAALINGASVEEVVSTLNTLGVQPRDIINIFRAIKKAGALQAEVEVM